MGWFFDKNPFRDLLLDLVLAGQLSSPTVEPTNKAQSEVRLVFCASYIGCGSDDSRAKAKLKRLLLWI